MIEIRFHGRGGQGAVTAAEILARALVYEGKRVQYFADFGIERRGAPVKAFLRIDDKEIYLRSQIDEPDYVVVLSSSLIKEVGIISGLKAGGWLIINSSREPSSFKTLGPFKIATVNATEIALKQKIGSRTEPIVNTVILGAAAKILELSLKSLELAIQERIEQAEKNISGAREAYETLKFLGVNHEKK